MSYKELLDWSTAFYYRTSKCSRPTAPSPSTCSPRLRRVQYSLSEYHIRGATHRGTSLRVCVRSVYCILAAV